MPMTHDDAVARLRTCPGWQLQGDALVRQFTFPSFADAVAFIVRLGFDAEASDHHPDLLAQGHHQGNIIQPKAAVAKAITA